MTTKSYGQSPVKKTKTGKIIHSKIGRHIEQKENTCPLDETSERLQTYELRQQIK